MTINNCLMVALTSSILRPYSCIHLFKETTHLIILVELSDSTLTIQYIYHFGDICLDYWSTPQSGSYDTHTNKLLGAYRIHHTSIKKENYSNHHQFIIIQPAMFEQTKLTKWDQTHHFGQWQGKENPKRKGRRKRKAGWKCCPPYKAVQCKARHTAEQRESTRNPIHHPSFLPFSPAFTPLYFSHFKSLDLDEGAYVPERVIWSSFGSSGAKKGRA
jgi:hypothetical protein